MKTPKTTSRRSFLKNTALAIPAILLASGLSAQAADAKAACGAQASGIVCLTGNSFDTLQCNVGGKVISCGVCSPGMLNVTCVRY